MPFSLRKLSKLNVIALCIVAMIGIATFGFQYTRQSRLPVITATINPIPSTQKNEAVTVPETDPNYNLLLVLRPEGIEPNAISIPKGAVRLILLNRSGVDEPLIQLNRVVGNKEKLKEVKLETKKGGRWYGLLDLTPGDYVVSSLTQPQWECKITVTSK
jgi:hypothetical protein